MFANQSTHASLDGGYRCALRTSSLKFLEHKPDMSNAPPDAPRLPRFSMLIPLNTFAGPCRDIGDPTRHTRAENQTPGRCRPISRAIPSSRTPARHNSEARSQRPDKRLSSGAAHVQARPANAPGGSLRVDASRWVRGAVRCEW